MRSYLPPGFKTKSGASCCRNPRQFYSNRWPLKRKITWIIAVFRNGIITLDESGEILSQDYIRAGEMVQKFKPSCYVYKRRYFCFSPRLKRSVLLTKQFSAVLGLINRFLQTSGRFVIPLMFLAVAGSWLLKRYICVKRAVLQAVVDLPTSGIVIVLD